MILKGKGFHSTRGASATIRFSCEKGFIEVQGKILSDEEISLRTPAFEKYGPLDVEVHVKLSSQLYSNGAANFTFFSITDARKSVAFGPGILVGNKTNNKSAVIIQAKDKDSNDRTCGMDKFNISIQRVDEEEISDRKDCDIDFELTDNEDGTYKVEYTPRVSGRYKVAINLES